jgi:hypothetical protein
VTGSRQSTELPAAGQTRHAAAAKATVAAAMPAFGTRNQYRSPIVS